MGHKVNPKSLRLGIHQNWDSRYFVRKDLPLFLREDQLIRKEIHKKFNRMGIEAIEIERSGDSVQIKIRSSRPGMIIGRGGSGIEDIRKELIQKIQKMRRIHKRPEKFNLQLSVEEVKKPETSAAVVAENIAVELEKRTPFRRVIKQALGRIMQSKEVRGARTEISRTEQVQEGSLPLVTIRSDIDYAENRAYCTYGVVGIKVWIYKGERVNI